MNVFWMHRDCRLQDNPALVAAASAPVPLCILYIYDNAHLSSETFHQSHLRFINHGLQCLHTRLQKQRGQVTFREGHALQVFKQIHHTNPISAIHVNAIVPNHQERQTRADVRQWAQHVHIIWNESPIPGIVSTGRPTVGWAQHWLRDMHKPVPKLPQPLNFVSTHVLCPGTLLEPHQLSALKYRGERPHAQIGGELKAASVLDHFLYQTGKHYSSALSSPVTAWHACSRLSPYLAWGHISLRTVFQALHNRQQQLREQNKQAKRSKPADPWLKSMSAFGARLRWRSHFAQKLYDDPQMQTRNACHAYDGLRESEWRQHMFQAWISGRTGFPIVDACMRALHQSGWINFRMRAMLVSFASYTLWLDWKRLASPLARLFLDYEPGIHYPQLQMQAGTTGVNALRIYNVTKQLLDHDPEGQFVRRYVPELCRVPNQYLAEPSSMALHAQVAAGCRTGVDYPSPIVDASEAYKSARRRFSEIRNKETTRKAATAVYDKHGSRRGRQTVSTNKRERKVQTDSIQDSRPRKTRRTRRCSVCASEEHIKGPRCCIWMSMAHNPNKNCVKEQESLP